MYTNQNDYYPSIKFHQDFIDAQNFLPKSPPKPVSPYESQLEDTGAGSGCLTVSIIIPIIICISLINIDFDFIYFSMVIMGFSFYLVILILDGERNLKEQNEKKKNSYRKNKNHYENIAIPNWQSLVSKYEKEIAFADVEGSWIFNLRKEKCLLSLEQTLRPEYYSSGNPQKGLSEDYFYAVLNKNFPNKIFRKASIKIAEEIDVVYFPDFVFYDEVARVCIDIEIDEPYTLKDKMPIHTTDSTHDDIRNEYFTSYRWIVIRFSENQVLTNPEGCCKVIEQVLNQVFSSNDLSRFDAIPNLINEKRWSSLDAIELSQKKFREKKSAKINRTNLTPMMRARILNCEMSEKRYWESIIAEREQEKERKRKLHAQANKDEYDLPF